MSTLGREKFSWSQEIWNQIDQAVHDEAEATRVARKFLPLHGPLDPAAQTVQGQTINPGPPLTITPGQQIVPFEIWMNFELNPQQITDTSVALALVRRAANQVARAEDILIFQGTQENLGGVQISQPVPKNPGLTTDAAPVKINQPLFETLVAGIAELDSVGHHGPYALVVRPEVYAAAHIPAEGTAILPVDRIKPLVAKGFFSSSALQVGVAGLLVSFGGNSVDLAVTQDLITAFVHENINYGFRVFERFALRINDPNSTRRLDVPMGAQETKQGPSKKGTTESN